MNFQNIVVTATAIVSLVTALVSIWNGWQNKSIALIIAELRLNLRREFNGRYETIEDAIGLKERVQRLEDIKLGIRR
jgi:hypothetical protein